MNVDDFDVIAILKSKGNEVNQLPVNCFAIDEDDYKLVYIELLSRAVSIVNRYLANWRKNRHTEAIVDTDILLVNADNPFSSIAVRMLPKEKIYEIHRPGLHGWANVGFAQTEMRYVFGGTEDTPAPHFVQALQMVAVPFLEKWATPLWVQGIKAELIVPLHTYRVNAWKIGQEPQPWRNLVKILVEKKEILV